MKIRAVKRLAGSIWLTGMNNVLVTLIELMFELLRKHQKLRATYWNMARKETLFKEGSTK